MADKHEDDRCAEKACPWPAVPGQGICALHVLQNADPAAFGTAQPSGTLQAYALRVYDRGDEG
jgi:hypothetical protein